jgi:hypothetical protein
MLYKISYLRFKKHIDLQMHPSIGFNNMWKLAIQQNANKILPNPQNFPILEEKKRINMCQLGTN